MSEYRLEGLAAASGVSVRNIRAYRERGLLDAPRREGRSAWYDDRHVAQLRAVNELLRRGFTSAHIVEFLEGTRRGRDLADVLGLQQAVFGPPRLVDAVPVAVAVPVPVPVAVAVDVDSDGEDARRLVQYGQAEVVDGDVTMLNPDVAEIVGGVAEQSAYVETILRVCDVSADLLDELAVAVTKALEQSLFARFGQDYVPLPEDVAEMRRVVADYRALGHRVVADQLNDALQRHLADQMSDLSDLSDYATDIALGG